MPYTPTFANSRALLNYNPQFLDTTPAAGTAAATPATGSQPDLTNRLLQIMSGQLGGTLTGGEKLSALGALLKSVSRGSQTSPQDVVRGIQQQKMAEVQGALQIQELRRAAAEKAQYDALRARLVANEQDPQRKAFLAMASRDALDKIAAQQFEAPSAGQWSDRLGRFIPKNMPVPTATGNYTDAPGARYTQYSNGDVVVTYKDGSQKRFDVEGNPIDG